MEHTAMAASDRLYGSTAARPATEDLRARPGRADRHRQRGCSPRRLAWRRRWSTSARRARDRAPQPPPAAGRGLRRRRWSLEAQRRPQLVALDADLVLDMRADAVRRRAFPTGSSSAASPSRTWCRRPAGSRSAGCCRWSTRSPASCSTRPNEQIYNNATERTKVIYVGSLAGLLPGGPGHSHQSVRDISALGGRARTWWCWRRRTPAETRAAVEYCARTTEQLSTCDW